MEPEIKFFMLERPRSVSDMIEQLTDRELSKDAGRRSEQIPRIAGNWFRQDSGYLWRLQHNDEIRDIGRRYELDRERLAEDFLSYLGVHHAFPYHAQHQDTAELNDAYARIMYNYTYGELVRLLVEHVFSGETMARIFAFDRWEDALLVPEADGRRIRSRRLSIEFMSSVHLMLLSSVLESRCTWLAERMDEAAEPEDDGRPDDAEGEGAEDDDAQQVAADDVETDVDDEGEDPIEDGVFESPSDLEHFDAKNRLDRLQDTRDVLLRSVVRAAFPWAETYKWGGYVDERVDQFASGFLESGMVIPDAAVSLLADVYLLSLNDGAQLFRQRERFDDEVHLLFDLFEQGWIVDPDDLDEIQSTGNIVVPMGVVRSYVHDLAYLARPTGAVEPER